VSHRQYGDSIWKPQEHDVVWKVVDWQSADVLVIDSRHRRPGHREALNQLKRPGDLFHKTLGDF